MKMPCRISDLSCIEHVFYDVDDRFIRIWASVPERMLSITSSILEDAQQTLRCRLNPNLVFVLADHLQFAIQRKEKGISFDMGVSFEIAYLRSHRDGDRTPGAGTGQPFPVCWTAGQ